MTSIRVSMNKSSANKSSEFLRLELFTTAIVKFENRKNGR